MVLLKKKLLFTCTNTSNKAIKIINARPGCGCTVAAFSKDAIEPNKTGFVKASFDSKKAHTSGDFKKFIVVNTDDSNEPINLDFHGFIANAPSNDKIMVPKK